MPLIRFTKLTDRVRGHIKRQTMRLPRKRPIKKGDLLHVYTMEKLGTARVLSVERKILEDITFSDAINDGFTSISECVSTLVEIHKCTLDQEIDIIKFDPHWKANVIMIVD